MARARAALTRYLSQDNPTINLTGQAGLKPATPNLSAGPMGNDLLGSFNWSGYADSSDTTGEFTAVSATWREQTCAAEACLDTGAEWIAERPEYPIGIAPLTYFSNLSMSRASQTSGGYTGSIAAGPDPERITMIDATSSYAPAVASGLSRGGSAITARWLNSY